MEDGVTGDGAAAGAAGLRDCREGRGNPVHLTATTRCTVSTSSGIDKDGEAQLSSLTVGDTVRSSICATTATPIDTLPAGPGPRPTSGLTRPGPG